MKCFTEGKLTFKFESDDSSQYDNWSFYRNQFNSAFGGTKAIDFISIDSNHTWLIEVKDYRYDRRTKPSDLADEVAIKVRDTLAGLVAAQSNANDKNEKRLASLAVRKPLKVVLHLEQPETGSRVLPRIAEPSNLTIKLKQLLKAVDAHPKVTHQYYLAHNMAWIVSG
jgi:hypothetical protein